MNRAVAAVTLGPTVHSSVYGKSLFTGEKPLPFVSGMLLSGALCVWMVDGQDSSISR